MEPVYSDVLVPPRWSSELLEERKKANEGGETVPWDEAVWKKGG